jgi:hypothetical protein
LLPAVIVKADLIRTLAKAHGAVSVELFGPAARGDERPDSDLDVMVEMEEGRSLLDLIGLSTPCSIRRSSGPSWSATCRACGRRYGQSWPATPNRQSALDIMLSL